jgi:peptide/nickel transport system ATP-binding protein
MVRSEERSKDDADAGRDSSDLLSVDGLTIDFPQGGKWWNVVNQVSFSVQRGEALGLVGESGCGKSTIAYSLLGYRRSNSRIMTGQVRFLGRDLLTLPEHELRVFRGRHIALVPQNPATALTPSMRIGDHLLELMEAHHLGESPEARADAVLALLEQVQFPQPKQMARRYPHELSGGQQQRVIIAAALACGPELIVLDEPTTGLDVVTQAQILELLRRLRTERRMAIVYVTHNLSVLSAICDRVGVIYAGELVEDAPVRELFDRPRHPYTQGLIASLPRVTAPGSRRAVRLRGLLQRESLPPGCRFAPRCPHAQPTCSSDVQTLASVSRGHAVACWRWKDIPAMEAEGETVESSSALVVGAGSTILEARGLACTYQRPGLIPFLRPRPSLVVRNASFAIREGETLGLVGESGSGKSSVARALVGLLPPVSGEVTFEGYLLVGAVAGRSKSVLRKIQLVPQNPDASLNPRQRVRDIIGRPLDLFFGLRGDAAEDRVAQLLGDVRLPAAYAARYPDELSGGERQRVAIARALAADPLIVLCDEIASALDVSVQADVLDLLRGLQMSRRISYLFISHDLAVVRSLAHRVIVLYRGELCEIGSTEEVFSPPFHPYTDQLLSVVPDPYTEFVPVVGTRRGPELDVNRTACPFAQRCPWKVGSICDEVEPPWQAVSETHAIRCHIPLPELAQKEASPRHRQANGVEKS